MLIRHPTLNGANGIQVPNSPTAFACLNIMYNYLQILMYKYSVTIACQIYNTSRKYCEVYKASLTFLQTDTIMAHVLILGASGISGWAAVNQATTYPTPDTFARITGTTNRPLTVEQAHLPNDPRINLVSGIDFTKPVAQVISMLKEKIPNINTVTHVIYAGKTSICECTDDQHLTRSSLRPD